MLLCANKRFLASLYRKHLKYDTFYIQTGLKLVFIFAVYTLDTTMQYEFQTIYFHHKDQLNFFFDLLTSMAHLLLPKKASTFVGKRRVSEICYFRALFYLFLYYTYLHILYYYDAVKALIRETWSM